jgi:hypothetical protein
VISAAGRLVPAIGLFCFPAIVVKQHPTRQRTDPNLWSAVMTPTNLLAPKGILWKIIESYGYDPAVVFARVGLTYDMLMKQGARVPNKTADRLWDQATALIKDPCLGLRAAEFWHPSHFNALGYAWLASSTLRDALSRLERYIHVLSQDIDVHLDDTDEGLTFTLSDTFEHVVRMDLSMATVMAMCRLNFGPKPETGGRAFHSSRAFVRREVFCLFQGPGLLRRRQRQPDAAQERRRQAPPQRQFRIWHRSTIASLFATCRSSTMTTSFTGPNRRSSTCCRPDWSPMKKWPGNCT